MRHDYAELTMRLLADCTRFEEGIRLASEALGRFAAEMNAIRNERLQRNVFFYTLACMAGVQLLAVWLFL
jgi:hypothetical protein